VRPSTPTRFRLLAWLGLGLLLASSSPHIHLAEAASAGRPTLHGVAAELADGGPSVSADEHHEQHSSEAPREAHPCGLCRSAEDQPLDRTPPLAVAADAILRAPNVETPPNPFASLFASLHPARAPPISHDA